MSDETTEAERHKRDAHARARGVVVSMAGFALIVLGGRGLAWVTGLELWMGILLITGAVGLSAVLVIAIRLFGDARSS